MISGSRSARKKLGSMSCMSAATRSRRQREPRSNQTMKMVNMQMHLAVLSDQTRGMQDLLRLVLIQYMQKGQA